MNDERLINILHPRITRRSGKLFTDGHYPEACHRAFEVTAQAIKEKTGNPSYGRRLGAVLSLRGKGVKLRTPFGDAMQEAAAAYFDAAFRYYRNYAAHEGDRIDRASCLRGLVIASELLELVGASDLSFDEVGGLQGLVDIGEFASTAHAVRLMRYLDGQWIVDDAVDSFFEDLTACGYSETQMRALLDLGLVEYAVSALPSDPQANPDGSQDIGVFEITALGKAAIDEVPEPVQPE